jgi:hypothetical protein
MFSKNPYVTTIMVVGKIRGVAGTNFPAGRGAR